MKIGDNENIPGHINSGDNENIPSHSSLHARMFQISFIHVNLMKFKEVGSIYSVPTSFH